MRTRAHPRTLRRSGLQLVPLVFVAVLAGAAVLWGVVRAGWIGSEDESGVQGAPVQRGPLKITVVERGNLKAADSVSLKSEIEGMTTILFLVPEGTIVEEGTLLCELDATELIDKRFQQEISVRNAEAAYVKAKQTYEIQKSQNDSDIKKAEQELYFAEVDLEKFKEGERKAKEAEAEEAIKLAEEELTRAAETLDWSQKLYEKGFLKNTELEADRLSFSRAQINLEQAKRDKDLLVRFQLPRDESERNSILDESRRELERVNLQAQARIVDYEADMTTNEAKLSLEREKLSKLETQIRKAKLIAPRAGMVVYAQEEGGRWGNDQPIKEGTEVRERQEIITIPSAGGMIAQASLHESVLKQVEIGQPAIIKVDAIPGREIHGRVKFVAVLPDQNSWWANPNTRLYRTDIAIDDASGEMRPGMSCAIEILVEEIPETLFVPVQAVFRRGTENVTFVRASGGLEERVVEIGGYNDRWVEIKKGLEQGEIVLLSPPEGFVPTPAPEEEEEEKAGPEGGVHPGGGPGARPPAAQAGGPGGDAGGRERGRERAGAGAPNGAGGDGAKRPETSEAQRGPESYRTQGAPGAGERDQKQQPAKQAGG